MKFKVGPWYYRVRISDGQLFEEAGKARDGLCVWSDRIIWISETLPLEQREDTLLHEIAHAWEHHFGKPDDSEGRANQNSSYAKDVWNQLQRQGGCWALGRMTAGGVGEAVESTTPMPTYAIRCGNCGSLTAIGSVRISEPTFNPGFGCLSVERSMNCEDCGHDQSWIEGVTPTGKPNGVILEAPKMPYAAANN